MAGRVHRGAAGGPAKHCTGCCRWCLVMPRGDVSGLPVVQINWGLAQGNEGKLLGVILDRCRGKAFRQHVFGSGIYFDVDQMLMQYIKL